MLSIIKIKFEKRCVLIDERDLFTGDINKENIFRCFIFFVILT